MQVANGTTVLGDFASKKFTAGGVTSTFTVREGKFVVTTDGPGGQLTDYPIAYTFGLYPLQQYLIESPGGRQQALGIAWDSRPKAEAGQRWFHLYGDHPPKAGEPLHWTGIDQNWNYQCADCHSTNVRKGYEEPTAQFHTTWAEISVGCEACHGPGSNHIAWAKLGIAERRRDPASGLAVALNERADAGWTINAVSGNASRAHPRTTNREIETCARCHARRSQFTDDWSPGQALGEAFRPSLLTGDLYFVDGQQREEVYTYGAFLQSRMYANGVTCADCHDPHTQQLRASGNAVCALCHAPSKYDAPSHTHHLVPSAGAQCAACHMPTTTYMRVDPRHDHSLRIPRPDRSATLGVPNACNGCHLRESPQWAAAHIAKWFPHENAGFQSFAEAFKSAERDEAGSSAALLGIINDRTRPAIVRASALQRLRNASPQAALSTFRSALDDPDYLVRAAAAEALENADAQTRAELLARVLGDPVRLVRMDAARALAGEPEARLDGADRSRFEHALDEYVQAQRFNADRPEAQAALGNLYATRGHAEAAAAAYRQALALDPTYVPAALNLADLERALGQEAESEKTIRAILGREPGSAPAHHALGLALVREKRYPEALAEFARATELAPDDARFAYVYAVALNDTGRPADARKVLRAALARHPNDRSLLFALVSYERAAGELDAARGHLRQLLALEPDDPDVIRLKSELGGAR